MEIFTQIANKNDNLKENIRKTMIYKHFIRWILVVFFVGEVGMMSFRRDALVMGWNELILFIISILLGIIPLTLCWKRWIRDNGERIDILKHIPQIWFKVLLIIVAVIGITIPIPELSKIFKEIPISLNQSDIIPQIDVMLRLFFWEWSTPYQTITEFGYDLFSPYMPLHWGPFIIPKLLDIDFRWFSYGIFCIWYITYVWWMSDLAFGWVYKMLLACAPIYFIHKLALYMPSIFGHTVETLIMSYYLFLALSIFSRSPYIRAGGLVLCLLSRYSVLFWVPLYLGLIYLYENKKMAIRIGMISGIAILCLYILPFWLPDPDIFNKGLLHHKTVTERGWTYEGWYGPNGKPAILNWGVGLGRYFFDYLKGDILSRLHILQLTQLIVSILAVVGMGLLYPRIKRNIPLSLFLLLALKIYLTLFYQLNPLPFVYYLMVPASLSLVVLPAYFSFQNTGRP